ncbi:uncharacterized protein LOC110445130 [Mizuhopecten yessoensis]|uniref:Serine/threonine-protein kinase KIC1 n=1 Tax=Mizuhopecten yessoensis TaxID=6573 RepID=A0A210R087_MIZYE|nr:uncharacterized protein LOC110445130 [Mizuhopecten yessoensis]OWF54436.1 Serine/threonine-protein kinase KIC1 [Mizuhopecten yessoensis]
MTMDLGTLMLNKSVLQSENLGNKFYESRKYSLPGYYGCYGSRWTENRAFMPPRHHVVDDLLNSYSTYSKSEMELYVEYEGGLYNVCQPNNRQTSSDVEWRCLANQGDEIYQQLMRETHKQACLSNIGIGKETPTMPRFIQQNIYRQMKPRTSSVTTQAKVSMAEFQTQTHWTGMNSKDMATQAVQDTIDSGVQAKPGTAEFGTQAKPSAADFGTQAKPSAADFGTQAKPSATDFGTQAKPNVTEFGLQAKPRVADIGTTEIRPITVESSTQAVKMCTDTGIQMTPTDQQTPDHDRQYNTIKMDSRKAESFVVNVDGVALTLSKEDSSIIQALVKMAAANKSKNRCSNEVHNGIQGAAAASPSKALCNYAQEKQVKKSHGDIPKYYDNIPYEGHLDKYFSKTSPFSQYGYYAAGDIPATLDNIKIPIIYTQDITYAKGENNSVLLGRGSFGCVYFAKHRMHNMDFCVKEFEDDSTTLYDIHHEAQVLLYLQSTMFVPKCLGLTESSFVASDLSLVQECYAKGYTLKNLLKDRPPSFIKRKWIAVCYQLFWGLKMIHEKQVLLNDIKTDNVLVDYRSDDITNNVRFIDMGLATFRKGHRFSAHPTYMDNRENYAPEVRQGLFSTPASDLYSVGYMMDKISEKVGIIEIDSLAQMCIEDDPNDRPNCTFVLEKLEDIMENV